MKESRSELEPKRERRARLKEWRQGVDALSSWDKYLGDLMLAVTKACGVFQAAIRNHINFYRRSWPRRHQRKKLF